MIQAGKLSNRIDLQRNNGARNSKGELIDSWETYATVSAEILTGAGAERILGQQVSAVSNVMVRIRYYPGVSPKHRAKFGDRTFDINNVDNVAQGNREMILACKEVPN